MFLENLAFDAADPRRLGRFWEQAVGAQTLTDEPDGFETRLHVLDGPTLDLCFQRVAGYPTASPRLHLDLYGGPAQADVVERLLGLGATHLDIGQGEVPWVVLADPEGHPFCVMEEREAYQDTGPIAAIPVRGDDPSRDAGFWAELTGWQEYAGVAPVSLRHPTGRGPVLEFFTATEPKSTKNALHLDVRLEPTDDAEAVQHLIEGRGAARLDVDWGDLPWTVWVDPAGNEFCILPARTS